MQFIDSPSCLFTVFYPKVILWGSRPAGDDYGCDKQLLLTNKLSQKPIVCSIFHFTSQVKRFAGELIAICIESRKIPLIYALLKYDFLVLFPVNPQTLYRYRHALRLSRAKHDPSDAQLLVELIIQHPQQFKPLVITKPRNSFAESIDGNPAHLGG